jgi:uncharacterized glyoxalase superfamily protein PhnB
MAEPAISPMLSYEDAGRAAKWLADVFGLTEVSRFADDDGRVTHVVMSLGDGHVHLGHPGPHYVGPRRHAETCEQARRWRESPYVVDGVLAHVDDVDAHHAQAVAAGAVVLTPPGEGGAGRQYRVEDVEGHRWMFAERR